MSDLSIDVDPVRAPLDIPKRKNWGRIWRVTIKSLRVNSNAPTDASTSLMLELMAPEMAAYNYVEVMKIEQMGWSPEQLHIKFDADMVFYQAYWIADVVIYNLNDPAAQGIIEYGMTCTVEAGYQEQGLGKVYEGTIFQPLWEKENGTDWKLTLHCIVGIIESTNNFIGHTVAGGVSQRDLVADMLKNAKFPIQLNTGEFPADKPKLTRATTYFGQPNDLLQNVADTNDCLLWFSSLQANMFQIKEAKTTTQWDYGFENGLIGTPQQTQKGVALRVLLNPDIQMLHQVKLSRAVAIKQLPRTIPGLPMMLTEDYTYIVGGIHHYGDSRGNDWYTDITAFFSADQYINQI